MENTNELLYMSRMCDSYAQTALFQQFAGLLKHIVLNNLATNRKYMAYEDDIQQEAWLGLLTAIERYREDKDATFITFMCLVVRRRIWNALKTIGGQDISFQFETTNIDGTIDDSERVVDTIAQRNPMYDPEYYMHYADAEKRFIELKKKMTPWELKILEQWIKGSTYEEAAKALDLSKKSYEYYKRVLKKKIVHAVTTQDELRE